MNSIFAIAPYKWNNMWVFDDPARGLAREPFVAGADTIIDLATAQIPGAARGFILLFSAVPFPGAQICLKRLKGDRQRGNTYFCAELETEAWLCPALYQYYQRAPSAIYAQFQPKQTTSTKTKHECQKTGTTNQDQRPQTDDQPQGRSRLGRRVATLR